MQQQNGYRTRLAALSLAGLAMLTAATSNAQEADDGESAEVPAKAQVARPELAPPGPIEEVVVVGRLLSGAEALTDERLELPFSADFLSFEAMSRAGDVDIASALRRVPGLTVVDGKFVYVRGLGERYSSVTVNSAAIPSPDLTRSVIPLDLFPTSIVESVKIQKSPSPDVPASFGGGYVDIRTSNIPDDVVAWISLGMGSNNVSDSAGLSYPGQGTPLPAAIASANAEYRGNISISNIFNTLNFAGQANLGDAQAIHQSLIDSLNTNVGSSFGSLDPDLNANVALGNSWYLGNNEAWRFGILVNGNYREQTRNENQRREGVGAPDLNFVEINRTTYEERSTAALNLGLEWMDDHSLELSYYALQNDEDQASIARGFDANFRFPDQKLNFSTRLEERELTVGQISGTHTFSETPRVAELLEKLNLEKLKLDWSFSDSQASTDIPNQTDFQGLALLDPDTGRPVTQQLSATTGMGQFSFLELEDDMNSWGGNVRLPLELGSAAVTLSGGWWGSKKARSYSGYNVNLNSVGVPSNILRGGPADVLEPGNLTVANGFNITLGNATGNESYLAAQKVDAAYGMLDATFNDRWRVTAGARFEDYQQAVLPINLLDFSVGPGSLIGELNNQLLDPNQRLAVREDDTYASLAGTYLGSGLLGADEYQFRLSYGETVVRPDLREISDVVYLDPELNIQVRGNPLLLTSPISNFELRGEFYYPSGDNFTVSLFYKDIDKPIERIRTAGSDDDISLTFINADSGEVFGVEFEALKSLRRGLFIAANVTLSDSELKINTGGITGGPTNATRRLTGHSEWVVNATLGFDSDNGKHSAFLNWNAYGERIFYAGIGGNQDAFEQPFQSLGIVYKYFPTDNLQIDVKIDNILDDELEFEQVSSTGSLARIISQQVGSSFSLTGRWNF